MEPPILHLLRPSGRFILYSDTTNTHTGSLFLASTGWKTQTVRIC